MEFTSRANSKTRNLGPPDPNFQVTHGLCVNGLDRKIAIPLKWASQKKRLKCKWENIPRGD